MRQKIGSMVHSKQPHSYQHLVSENPKTFMDMEKCRRRHKELDWLYKYQQKVSEMLFFTVKYIKVPTAGANTFQSYAISE